MKLLVSCLTNSMTFVTVATVCDSRRDDESIWVIGEEKQQRSTGRPAATPSSPW